MTIQVGTQIANELDSMGARRYWSEAEMYLRQAVYGADPDSYIRNVQAKIFAGISTLWRIEEENDFSAYIVTGLYTVDGLNTVAQVHLMTAKDMDKILPFMDYFHLWAKKRGATWLEVIGRKGWERKLKPYGFNHEYTSLMKRVTTEIH